MQVKERLYVNRGNRTIEGHFLMRAFPTHIHNVSPSYSRVSNGASQGSVPGPTIFTLYMLPSGKIIWQAGINFNCSADDTQRYLSMKPEKT